MPLNMLKLISSNLDLSLQGIIELHEFITQNPVHPLTITYFSTKETVERQLAFAPALDCPDVYSANTIFSWEKLSVNSVLLSLFMQRFNLFNGTIFPEHLKELWEAPFESNSPLRRSFSILAKHHSVFISSIIKLGLDRIESWRWLDMINDSVEIVNSTRDGWILFPRKAWSSLLFHRYLENNDVSYKLRILIRLGLMGLWRVDRYDAHTIRAEICSMHVHDQQVLQSICSLITDSASKPETPVFLHYVLDFIRHNFKGDCQTWTIALSKFNFKDEKGQLLLFLGRGNEPGPVLISPFADLQRWQFQMWRFISLHKWYGPNTLTYHQLLSCDFSKISTFLASELSSYYLGEVVIDSFDQDPSMRYGILKERQSQNAPVNQLLVLLRDRSNDIAKQLIMIRKNYPANLESWSTQDLIKEITAVNAIHLLIFGDFCESFYRVTKSLGPRAFVNHISVFLKNLQAEELYELFLMLLLSIGPGFLKSLRKNN